MESVSKGDEFAKGYAAGKRDALDAVEAVTGKALESLRQSTRIGRSAADAGNDETRSWVDCPGRF